MFFFSGITVQPGFTYKRQIKYCIDIKNAVLNLKDVKPGDKTDGIVQVSFSHCSHLL